MFNSPKKYYDPRDPAWHLFLGRIVQQNGTSKTGVVVHAVGDDVPVTLTIRVRADGKSHLEEGDSEHWTIVS